MRRAAALVFACALTGLLACGGSMYALRVTRASNELTRAEQLDAARRAPYEYYYALEHLQKARSEAAEADYGDTVRLADTAFDYASRAVQLAQRVAPAPLPARGVR